jgi:DNA topoisomerase-1
MFKMGRTPAHEHVPAPDPAEIQRKKSSSAKGNGAVKRQGKLVIVESPAKAKTISKFLGRGYTVKASVGHVRDLLRSQLSVDIENNFEPRYRVPNEKRGVVKELKKLSAGAKEIYLATDPDREGEAIAWHLTEAAEMDDDRTHRVVFHEITKDAIIQAFANPRHLDMERVEAQQARRILDRLVGYKISPLLWRKVRSRTSAGRVQSVALRLIVEREQEINDFDPVEYWTIEADLARRTSSHEQFRAKLSRIDDEKIKLDNETEAQAIITELERSNFVIREVKESERRRRPAAPFTTSTLQQEASRRLGFGTRKTMSVAQQLYEGIGLGPDGTVGLITYMRTDSTSVSKMAQTEARKYIIEEYGNEMVPAEPPVYKPKNKAAQEAHEAVRPTSVWRDPDKIKQYLSRDQYRLYKLIWQRFVASQMANALYDVVSVTVAAGPAEPKRYRLQASGSRLRFRGFLTVYEETVDEDAVPDSSEDVVLPKLDEGEVVDLVELLPDQHFTQPPPRYTEATLVKTLEEFGIGRPSTYAPIISTIQQRGYVEKSEKRLYSTELGEIVNDLLVEYFPDIFNVQFTAQLEQDLDLVATGEEKWVSVLEEFFAPFSEAVHHAETHMPEVSVADQPTGDLCEKCGSPMVIKFGRYGKFEACSNFPECRNARPHLVKLGIACPTGCGGELVERRTKKGRVFYGCSNYPECEWSSWKRPLSDPCPNCGGLLVQKNRQWAKCLDCEELVELSRLPETRAAKDQTEPVMAAA